MPQFDFTQALPQIIWLTIVFALLYVVVRAMLPRVTRVVDNRKARIALDLEQAEAARTDAETATSDGGSARADARTRAMQLTGKARDDAAANVAQRLAEVDAGLEAQAVRAAEQLAAQRQQALAELDQVAGEATVELVRRVAGVEISNDEAASAVKKVAA